MGAEIASLVVEQAFDHLDYPVWRLGARNTPVPLSPPLDEFVIAKAERIADTPAHALMERAGRHGFVSAVQGIQ